MQEESRGVDYIVVNNFKVFLGLPVICKSTMSLKRIFDKTEKVIELKGNEEFKVIDVTIEVLQLKWTDISHNHFNQSGLA
jgi:hypothetical protein